MKKGLAKREKVFLLIVAAIIIGTIVIIVVNANGNKNNDNKQNVVEENKPNLEADVNPDAKPEENPAIGGTENVQASGNGEKVNTSSKLKEDKTFGIYKLTNITLTHNAQGTDLSAVVTTTATEKTSGRDVKVEFYDKAGNVVSIMGAYMPQVKPGQTTTLKLSTTADVTNAYDFKIVLN